MTQESPMSGGDYVWDRSGPPDATAERLESVLSGYRHKGREPELIIGPRAELRVSSPAPTRPPTVASMSRGRWTSIAAMAAMAVLAVWVARPTMGPWLKVESKTGVYVAGKLSAPDKLHVGQWLQTDAQSSAEIEVASLGMASLGTVTVRPNSKIRVKNTGEHEHRLEMPYGSIHAFITAPPRVFVVDTPAARAVDMGCEYTLDVQPDGSGILRVSLGHVLLEGPRGTTSEVPMWGGTCRIRPGIGPGTPYFDDASSRFIAALDRVDFGGEAGLAELQVVLDEARPKDALSLWHLLPKTSSEGREAVFARLSVLKPPPERASKRAVMGLDPRALKAWYEAMRPF